MKKFILVTLFCLCLAAVPIYRAAADDTPTETPTPTPTETPTPTQTNTPNYTVVQTTTPTNTRTRTPTRTIVPGSSITWINVDAISPDLLTGMSNFLLANPPAGEDGRVYTVTDQQATGTGSYIISLVNVNAASPDYVWGLDSGGFAWLGSLICSQSPTWECEEYTLESVNTAMSESLIQAQSMGDYPGGVRLPWKSGYKAVYGISGVHGADSGWLPGSRAVDFLGGDTMGDDIMPPFAYAADDGVVIFTCRGTNDTSILVDSGVSGTMLYAHLDKNDTTLQNGLEVHAGQPISGLTYGSFSGGPCGTWANQQPSQYHLHFAFMPTDGYFLIGNCALNISTQNFLCGDVTYGINSRIPNGGQAPPQTGTQTPCAGDGCVPPEIGGVHLWDSVVGVLTDVINYLCQHVLIAHTPTNLVLQMSRLIDQLGDVAMIIAASNLLNIVPAIGCYSIVLTMELFRLLIVAWRWFLRIVPTAG